MTLTDTPTTTGTAATLRLEHGKSARLFVSVATTWGDGKPATLAAEFFVAHHGGDAPEPSATASPPRTGLRRATAEVGGGSDGALEVTVTPDDSGGATATKNFAVRVYAADGGSGDARVRLGRRRRASRGDVRVVSLAGVIGEGEVGRDFGEGAFSRRIDHRAEVMYFKRGARVMYS